MNHDIEVPQVILVRYCTDTWHPRRYQVSGGSDLETCCEGTCGSAIRRSVSFTILLGKAAMVYIDSYPNPTRCPIFHFKATADLAELVYRALQVQELGSLPNSLNQMRRPGHSVRAMYFLRGETYVGEDSAQCVESALTR